jgi:hypothetical protein
LITRYRSRNGGKFLAPKCPLWQASPRFLKIPDQRFSVPSAHDRPLGRCRSSVVEHSLGKGEVVSSILTGSTRFFDIERSSGCDLAAAFAEQSEHIKIGGSGDFEE